MKHKKKGILELCHIIVPLTILLSAGHAADQKIVYEANWHSLAAHKSAPEWFQDAKLGIYFHWGVYCVTEFETEWYPRFMHLEGHPVNKYHRQTFGELDEFGYHDFVEDFTAEHFDPDEWATLFKQAGARFAGPVAEHHDGFSMWASEVTPWNAKSMGPRRDITGELAAALREREMRLITTFHHSFNLQRHAGIWESYYPYVTGTATASDDPKLQLMYGNIPEEQWLETVWFAKLKEVIDNYQPDIIWFDSWLNRIPASYRKKFCAYYLNAAQSWQREVVIVRKQEDLPLEFTVLDLEKSRQPGASKCVWMTDDTISTGSWSYTNNLTIKPTGQVVHSLIDTVSKNGVVLLNISPKANGIIPTDQRQVLLEMGKWLEQNGEAIYETRPWLTYGEGPTQEPTGGFGDAHIFLQLHYGARDIRYTASKDGKTLYAIVMGWPETTEIAFESVYVNRATSQSNVSLLGYPEAIQYRLCNQNNLILSIPQRDPDQRPGAYAYVFKIEGFELSLNPYHSSITLQAEAAVLSGQQIRLEKQGNGTNVGYWDSTEESVHWLVNIPEAGFYRFRGEFASIETSELTLRINEHDVRFRVPNTGGWSSAQFVEIGSIYFERSGVYHVQLHPSKNGHYRPVNLWKLEYAKKL